MHATATALAKRDKWGHIICEHNRERRRCKECGGSSVCEHGRERSQCRECGGSQICKHGRQRSKCKKCGGVSICEHGRLKSYCKDCGGSQICEHGRQRSTCRECGGSQICEHDCIRQHCKKCGGSGICEHNIQKYSCIRCGGEKFVAVESARASKRGLRKFLEACEATITDFECGLPNVTSEKLEEIAQGNGQPDWKDEAIEEKRLNDTLSLSQWARAILHYRSGKPYRVNWRISMWNGFVFENVFAFHKWMVARGELAKLGLTMCATDGLLVQPTEVWD